jgi:hypothetical protein
MRMLAVGMMLSVCVSGANAQALREFSAGVSLATDGQQPLYELAVPRVVYEGVVRADLGDIRVFNGAEEIVPHAFRARLESKRREPTVVALPAFPLHGAEMQRGDGIQARVERDGDKFRFEMTQQVPGKAERILGYVLDTSALEVPIRALRFDASQWPATTATSVRIESSDDLRSWGIVARDAPIFKLEAAGQQLRQDRVELGPRKAKYWRITWLGQRRALEIGTVTAELAEGPIEPAREWKELAVQAANAKPGEYLFDLGGQFPIDRVRLALPDANTVAVVELLTRARAADPWRSIARASAYRLTQDGTEVTSSPIAVPATTDRHLLIRVDQRGGGLGQGVLAASIGWVPHRLVFVARGNGPFQLAFGHAHAAPSGYQVETLIPGFNTEQERETAKTNAGTPVARVSSVGPATVAGPVRAIAGEAAKQPSTPIKLWALWASIIGGVAVLAWMAWRLSRQMSAPSAASASESESKKP